jgi:hypothetical protein
MDNEGPKPELEVEAGTLDLEPTTYQIRQPEEICRLEGCDMNTAALFMLELGKAKYAAAGGAPLLGPRNRIWANGPSLALCGARDRPNGRAP